jgi:hypothetical protein
MDIFSVEVRSQLAIERASKPESIKAGKLFFMMLAFERGRTQSSRLRERDKPRLSLKNNTAGVREREDVNRTREAGSRDEVEGVVANTLKLYRNGASLLANSFGVGFIDWLDALLMPHQ